MSVTTTTVVHLMAYIAHGDRGGIVTGIARVPSTRPTSPSIRECFDAIPDLIRPTAHLGLEPQYTLHYRTAKGAYARRLGASGVERVGRVLMNLAGRGEACDIEVVDTDGVDVTFDFAAFRD